MDLTRARADKSSVPPGIGDMVLANRETMRDLPFQEQSKRSRQSSGEESAKERSGKGWIGETLDLLLCCRGTS